MSTLQGAVADRYSRAIFELGQEKGELEPLRKQLGNFASVYAGSPELRAVLDNPVVEESKREAVLKDVASKLGVGQLAMNTLRLLASRHRLFAIVAIARRLDTLTDDRAGLIRATVTSAKPLSDSFAKQLQQKLEKLTSRKVVLEREVDPTLIAGLITRIGDNTIDGSVRGRLRQMERSLLAGSSNELGG